MKPRQLISIGPIGLCNLHCPTCPTGRGEARNRVQHELTVDLLRRVLTKATREARIIRVDPFNWGDSLVLPHLGELIDLIQVEFGLRCGISTNLNYSLGVDTILKHPPFKIIVSLSGFTQSTYSKTHTGGDIEKVKDNLTRLSSARRWDGWPTKVTVAWHRYHSNLGEEAAMKNFVRTLGFKFAPVTALILPLDEIITVGKQHPISDNLLVSPEQGISAARWWLRLSCFVRTHMLSMDSEANVNLCCSTFGDGLGVGNYLDSPLWLIQQRKDAHPFCNSCQNTGVLSYFQGAGPMRWLNWKARKSSS
jgi:hypothetical protein